MFDLNSLQFGNPNRSHLIYLQTEGYLDKLVKELSSFQPNANDSVETESELVQLVSYTDYLQNEEDLQQRFELYDSYFEDYMIDTLVKAGLDKTEVTNLFIEIHKDIVPLLVKIKYAYNRPRPYQVAYYKNIGLYPFRSKFADSPSYPSGHAYQAIIYAEVLGNRYPKFYKALTELAEDIAVSRIYMGIHFQSDVEFAKYAAQVVLAHPDFRAKYKL